MNPLGGGGSLTSVFNQGCATGISEPLPHYSKFLVLDYFVASYRPHLCHFWASLSILWSVLGPIRDFILVTFGQLIFFTPKSRKSATHSSNSERNARKDDPIIVSPVVKIIIKCLYSSWDKNTYLMLQDKKIQGLAKNYNRIKRIQRSN